MPAAPGIVKRALRSVLTLFRFLLRHQWLTSALILASAITTLVLWALLLPLPEAHGAYAIQKSLRFNDDDSDNNLSSGNYTAIRFTSGNALEVFSYASGYQIQLVTSPVFRDPSAWMHVAVAVDSTQGTASDRVKLYINGQRITSFGTETYPSQNASFYVSNSGAVHRIGAYNNTSTGNASFFDGYMSDVYFIDGQALDPSYFGETDATTGTWKAKAYSGTYGTNGFHLDFADSSALGNDVSGNNNDWTANNLDATDQVRDTPTNNYATMSSINTASGFGLRDGGLRFNTTSNNQASLSSTAIASGTKVYFEFTNGENAGGVERYVGVTRADVFPNLTSAARGDCGVSAQS